MKITSGMNDQQKKRLEELRWENERNQKQSALMLKLQSIFSIDVFSFVSYVESDTTQLSIDDWPSTKWEEELFIQTKVSDSNPITEIAKRFVNIIEQDYIFVFFMNYNFGLVQLVKELAITHWQELVELDGDEIFLYAPGRSYFICIEKTEDFIVKDCQKAREWIYEVTFSNRSIKGILTD